MDDRHPADMACAGAAQTCPAPLWMRRYAACMRWWAYACPSEVASRQEPAPSAAAPQVRYAAGAREMLEDWFQHKPFPEDFYIVREGKLAEQYT